MRRYRSQRTAATLARAIAGASPKPSSRRAFDSREARTYSDADLQALVANARTETPLIREAREELALREQADCEEAFNGGLI